MLSSKSKLAKAALGAKAPAKNPHLIDLIKTYRAQKKSAMFMPSTPYLVKVDPQGHFEIKKISVPRPTDLAEHRVRPLRWPLTRGPRAEAAPRGLEEITAFKNEMKLRLAPRALLTGIRAMDVAAAPVTALPATNVLGIVGVGFGAKISDDQVVRTECVRIYVTRKLPKSQLSAARMIPASLNGLPTDVIEAPNIVAQTVPCGVSIGHFKVTAGTLGCLVTKGGRTFILSNNHVLANSNNAAIGDEIWQPGQADGGGSPPIAHLSEFEPLRFNGGTNTIDAAIGELVAPGSVLPQMRLIGTLSPVLATAVVGLAVKKCGRSTDLTSGFIEGISEDITVGYDAGDAEFQNQIAVRATSGLFSDGGDSGSLVVTGEGNHPLSLHFAGDPGKALSFGSGIAGVLTRFGVTIMT